MEICDRNKRAINQRERKARIIMHGIIYLVGLVVVVLAILSLLGLA